MSIGRATAGRRDGQDRGDPRAIRDHRFAEVVRAYEAAISRYLSRMVNDVELARDLTQETFLSAYRAWPDPEPTHLGAWLYRIATNHALGHFRRQKLVRWIPLSRLAHRDGQPAGQTDTAIADRYLPSSAAPDAGVVESDLIRAILDGMDPRDRAALLLQAAGFSGEEIAEQLGCSHGAARTRISRARGLFRERYGAATEPPAGSPVPIDSRRDGSDHGEIVPHPALFAPPRPRAGRPSRPASASFHPGWRPDERDTDDASGEPPGHDAIPYRLRSGGGRS